MQRALSLVLAVVWLLAYPTFFCAIGSRKKRGLRCRVCVAGVGLQVSRIHFAQFANSLLDLLGKWLTKESGGDPVREAPPWKSQTLNGSM